MHFRFVHASDLHLDCPFVSRGESVLATRLRQATFLALERIVSLCLDQKVDFLLLAGDVFDAKDRSVQARLFLHKQLTRLDDAGIATFMVHGNHDPLSGDRGKLGLPESVEIFGTEWREVEFRRAGQFLCRVQGISYGHEAVVENLARRFGRIGSEFTIGLLHANVGGHDRHPNYAPCTLADLSISGLDYWALGHVHTRAQHSLPSGGTAVYPGNPQGRHAYETGARGCVLVTVDGQHSQIDFHPTDSVRWHRRELEIGGAATLAELAAQACENIVSAAREPDLTHAVQLSLVGRGDLHREFLDEDAAEQFREHLREELVRYNPRVFLESLVDQTAPALPLEELRHRPGLTRAIVEAAEAAQSEGGSSRLWDDEDLKRVGAALRKVSLDWPMPRGELLDRAATRVLDLIVESSA